jgi:hypothetical protein
VRLYNAPAADAGSTVVPGWPRDPLSLGYYALVCGALSLAAPRWPTPGVRFLVGVAVGIVAAVLLPTLRGALAGG